MPVYSWQVRLVLWRKEQYNLNLITSNIFLGHRCYREYPDHWIERHVKAAGLRLLDKSTFPILYSRSSIQRQLDVARSKLRFFSNKSLADEMAKEITALQKECELLTSNASDGRIKLGFDYVITAEK